MTRRSLLLVLAWAAAASCGEPSATAHPPSPAAPMVVPTQPTAWRGDLPCADCAGIRTLLVLDPDGTYRMQEGYPGKRGGGDTLVASFGQWTLSPGLDRIALHGPGEGPRRLSPRADGSLRLLDRSGEAIDSPLGYSLARLPDLPETSGTVRATGLFTYRADAALFVECAGGVQLPVAMTEGYLPLEQAYTAARRNGAPLLVRVLGRVEHRAAMEGDGTESMLVIADHETAEDATCEAAATGEALASAEWRLSALGAEPVTVPDGATIPTLGWDPAESRIAGNAGCNRFTARGFLRGTRLVTGPPAVTRMLCEGAMDLEERYLTALARGGRLRLDQDRLVLYSGPVEAARFVRD